MKKVFNIIVCTFISALVFTSCDVDFDPNEQWQEQMLVYSLLDQDDDTTFVRIEKCFLGNGNALRYAKEKDSIYYNPDDLDVKIYVSDEWDTNNIHDTLQFNYTYTSKTAGDFYSGDDCPIYYCVTKNKLSYWSFYKLVITNKKTGKQVTASTYLIADYSIRNSNFTFNNKKASTLNNRMQIEWTNYDASTNANSRIVGKQYQVNIRFNYLENSAIKHIDIPISRRLNNYSTSVYMNTYATINDVVSGISTQLKGKTALGWYTTAPFEIRILSCDLEMFDYLSINASSTSSLNYRPVYTNINGGIGLFAARRTHISKSFEDKQVDGNLKTQIKSLGLGF